MLRCHINLPAFFDEIYYFGVNLINIETDYIYYLISQAYQFINAALAEG